MGPHFFQRLLRWAVLLPWPPELDPDPVVDADLDDIDVRM